VDLMDTDKAIWLRVERSGDAAAIFLRCAWIIVGASAGVERGVDAGGDTALATKKCVAHAAQRSGGPMRRRFV